MTENDVPLKEYLDIRFKSLELQIEAQSKLQCQHNELNELAIKTAKEITDNRLSQMNEFRDQMQDERALFATKESVENSNKEINSLKEWKSNMEGKASQSSVNVVMVFAVIGTLLSIVGLVMNLR